MPGAATSTLPPFSIALLLAFVGARPAAPPECADPYGGRRADDGERARYCEVRTITLAAPGSAGLTVDGASDGGVAVRGADTARTVTVRAVIRAWGNTEDEARAIATAVRVDTAGAVVRADGPERHDWLKPGWWSVAYVVTAPRRTSLTARTNNGGVRVAGLMGRLRIDTNNGGVRVDSVGGDVVAHSNNGGAQATLAGAAWDAAGLPGAGLDLSTNNGGAVLRVPAGYSARLKAAVRSGPLTVEFPVTVLGRFDTRSLDVTLGAGGAPVRVSSNNGGVRLARAGAADAGTPRSDARE